MATFNTTHPELKEGEIFLTNAEIVEHYQIGWKTKRLGETAYDIDGKPVNHPGFIPVFVQKQELIDAGMKIENGEIVSVRGTPTPRLNLLTKET